VDENTFGNRKRSFSGGLWAFGLTTNAIQANANS
jgi:hypothetical protein